MSDTVELDTPGAMIRWAREQAGMSQSDIADELGIFCTQVSKWERDVACPNARNFIDACAACGFNVVLEPMTGKGR